MNIESNSKKRRRLEFEDKGDEIGTDGNSVEVEDTEPLLVVDEAISITLIASEIFRCLSHQDLLNCSLVNKTWNVSARFALREDRQSCVRIGRRGLQSQFPCEELTLFYNLISKSWSHPFNGFSFTFSSTNQGRRDSIDHICPSSTDKSELAISSVIEKLLSEINIKYLRICMTQKPTYICPVAIFMADIIKNPDLSKNLVGLLIDELPNLPRVRSNLPGIGWSSPVIRDFFTYFSSSTNSSESPMYFPNLKFLKLPDCTTLWGYTCPINRIFKQLLLASPKVTDLKGYIPLDLFQTVAQLPVTRNWVLQNLNLEIMSNLMLEILSMKEGNEDGVIVDVGQMLDLMLTFVDKQSIIKIQNLTVKADSIREYSKTVRFFDFEESDFERIRNLRAKTVTVGIKLIESSCKYIRSLEINSTDLLPVIFKHYGESEESCLKLNQLSHLTIESTYMAEGALESLYNLSVYGFEFFCPYLKSVELVWNRPDDYNYDQMERFLPIPPDDDFIFPTNSCSPTVTKFAISVGYGFSDVDLKQMILKCGKLFPNVKSFVADMFHCTEDVELYIEALWTAWPNLESIQLKKLCSFTIQKNWDYLFTGLSRRDCTRFFRPWKIWTDEQFQKLQKAHSLVDFTKLKHLQFQINHWKCEEGKRQRRPRLARIFLSKLTGHFIFRRMPQLKVHILRTCCDGRATETNPVKCRFKLKHLQKYVQFDPAN